MIGSFTCSLSITDTSLKLCHSWAWYDSLNSKWAVVSSKVDTTAKTILAITNHFSLWGVIDTTHLTTRIENPGDATPTKTTLSQNIPNPFNPSTTIRFGIPKGLDGKAFRLDIYDIKGQIVKRLASGRACTGWHQHIWHGTNNSSQIVTSGLYIYRLTVGNHVLEHKLTFMK